MQKVVSTSVMKKSILLKLKWKTNLEPNLKLDKQERFPLELSSKTFFKIFEVDIIFQMLTQKNLFSLAFTDLFSNVETIWNGFLFQQWDFDNSQD